MSICNDRVAKIALIFSIFASVLHIACAYLISGIEPCRAESIVEALGASQLFSFLLDVASSRANDSDNYLHYLLYDCVAIIHLFFMVAVNFLPTYKALRAEADRRQHRLVIGPIFVLILILFTMLAILFYRYLSLDGSRYSHGYIKYPLMVFRDAVSAWCISIIVPVFFYGLTKLGASNVKR